MLVFGHKLGGQHVYHAVRAFFAIPPLKKVAQWIRGANFGSFLFPYWFLLPRLKVSSPVISCSGNYGSPLTTLGHRLADVEITW